MASRAAGSSTWVRCYQPAPEAATRLLCFPHAGGSASYFLPFARDLAPHVEVLAVQYPGRQDRRSEPCVDDLRTLADLTTEQLRPWLDRPLALFGHSMGATLAYEVANRLERSGTRPVALIASGRRAPSRHRAENIHLLDDQGLIADVRRLSGTDNQILDDEEVLRMVLPSIRSDYKAAETYRYRPEPKLHCSVVAMTGDHDPQVSIEEAGAWSEHTAGTFELRVFPGGHFFINRHSSQVTAEIRARLARS
ncbi:thioesterase II family protein [Streptomyces coelicoflavus]|uniref:thioesterase II family protein n=1 Tax=Streptomyces coelicoflavus TaxID=285562 RepID=UPI0036CD04A8